MAFGIDDATAVVATEVTEEVLGKGAEVLEESLSELPFESSDFQEVSYKDIDDKIKHSELKKVDFDVSDKIEEEFSPDKFNNFAETENQVNDSEIGEAKTIERTSTFEEQTIDNSKLEDMRPDVEEGMILGAEHDGGILRKNMEHAMGCTSNPEESNAHHLVGRDTPQAAKKLEELGIDRNDPANGIFLPNSPESSLKGAVHGQGRHTVDYSNEVEQRFAGVTTREEALEVLQSLKEDLYNGDLSVHYDTQANK